MAFLIKARISDPRAKLFAFTAQKTMYGERHIAEGDTVFLFASENEGGQGLIGCGIVTSARTHREEGRRCPSCNGVTLTVRRTARAKRLLGRRELKQFSDWNDGRPGTELNFKF